MNNYLIVLSILVATASSSAHAQVVARAPVRGLDITGLELGLEGETTVTRGDSLRWLFSAHEVVGLSELRPAANAQIRVVTSIAPSDSSLAVTTDAYGRAALAMPVPADAPAYFMVAIELTGRANVHRRFELAVNTVAPQQLTIAMVRGIIPVGGTARAFGRLTHQRSHRPYANTEVEIVFRNASNAPLSAPTRLRTDAAGTFARSIRLPRAVSGAISVSATVVGVEGVSATAQAQVANPNMAPRLLLAAAPIARVLPPRDSTRVAVVVRSADGRPMARARVEGTWTNPGGSVVRGETDTTGRVELPFHSPDITTPFADFNLEVRASKAGYSPGAATITVRVAQTDYAATIAVEGGHLPEEMGATVWVRVVNIDGSAAGAGVPVRLSGPRLAPAGLTAVTDANGVAAFETALLPHHDENEDSCGGIAATAIITQVATGPRAAHNEHCLPIDPDAALRVRVGSPVIARGQHVRFELARGSSVRDLPVAVTALAFTSATSTARPLSTVVVGPRESVGEISLPEDAYGLILVRARPLVGAERMEVRGSMTALWVTPGAPITMQATLDSSGLAALSFGGSIEGERTVYSVALPIDDARAFLQSQRAQAPTLAAFGDARFDMARAGEPFLRALLSANVPLDADAPSVLRAGVLVPVPAPANPALLGHLRDPWRARARFVGGRLALLFHAIESVVDAAVPGHIENVAINDARGGWRFNERVMDAVNADSALGDGGATALGGDPLDIDALRALDASFTYDSVARRITRERLFTLLLDVRTFVRAHELDLRWGVRGDPTEWLRQAAGEPQKLADAWGRPFALRPAQGGRARFALLVPVPGYELVSSGPNGRFGDADDVWDPTGRVLSETSLYGRAVGENALVARLHGVELGRATASLVQAAFGGVELDERALDDDSDAITTTQSDWSNLPQLLQQDPDALALRRPARPGDGAGGTLLASRGAASSVQLALDAEPRSWGFVAIATTHDGYVAISHADTMAGSPLLIEEALPARVRVHEPVRLPLHVTNVGSSTLTFSLTTHEDVYLRISADREVVLRPQETSILELSIEGLSPGASEAHVAFQVNGQSVRTLTGRVNVGRGVHPIRRRATGIATSSAFRAELTIPDDAVDPQARVIAVTAQGLVEDPEFAEARFRNPAPFAWTYAVQGRAVPADLRAQLLQAQNLDFASLMAAIVVWSAADPSDTDSVAARIRALGESARRVDSLRPTDTTPHDVLEASTALLALAMGGTADPLDENERSPDRIASIIARLRTSLRATLRHQPTDPVALALASAALLLVQPADHHALAMYERAKVLIHDDVGGALITPSDDDTDATHLLSATLALALAAHTVGDEELSQRLLGGAFAHQAEIARLQGASLFWMLANAAYGALGADAPEQPSITINGTSTPIAFDHGRAIISLPAVRAGEDYAVNVQRERGSFIVARIEASFGVPYQEREGASITLAVAGETGHLGSRSALELSVTPHGTTHDVVLDISLPAGAIADDVFLSVLRGASNVAGVENREPGFVRITLRGLATDAPCVLPLPLSWQLAGTISGLGIVAYPEADPAAMTVIAPRSFVLDATTMTQAGL
ncbi:MAG: hypothetical protein IPK60_13040 [Sandaracinaceae bacterium]|nr:hypothetical protein [Sandaracinaceae bacterium]